MIKECVIFSPNFRPPREFLNFILSLEYSYGDMWRMSDLNFDTKIINYIKEHKDWSGFGKVKYAMRGETSIDYKCGFSGTATIIEVDTSLTWGIEYDSCDNPYPIYYIFNKNSYNYIEITKMKGVIINGDA